MREKRVHQLFVASVLAKGAHALFEIVAGTALYLVSERTLIAWINRISPGGWLDRFFHASDQGFYAFYLLSHGLIKGVLVIGLLREKLWAYPASIAVFGLFIGYQLYRYTHTHEAALIALSIFDLVVIGLAVHEYRLLRKHLPTH